MERSMEKVNSCGQMVLDMKENSMITISMVEEFMNGQMEGNLTENGRIIRCTETDASHGKMEESIKENIEMIRKKALVLFHGLMEGSMLVIGDKENNMEKELTLHQKEMKNMVNGKMERELDG